MQTMKLEWEMVLNILKVQTIGKIPATRLYVYRRTM
jgi:hypothetical protein